MTTLLSHLRRTGDTRISQRGEFNSQALVNFYDQAAADACDGLRRLVERTYGDQAEAVKMQIRDRYDADIPDADETATLAQAIESLQAIARFYNQVADEIKAGTFKVAGKLATLFELARQAIEAKPQWAAGESVTIWSSKVHKAYVNEDGRDGGGLLYLGMRNGQPGEQVEVVAGMLNPRKGWQFTLTRQDYNVWVLKVKRAYRMTPAFKPDLVMDFGKGDLSQFPVSHLSPEYQKRAQRARNA